MARCSGLTKAVGKGRLLLDGVDLVLGSGEIVGIAGPNGSGKTTLMRCLLGLVRPTGGTVELFGRAGPPGPHELRRVGVALDTPSLYPWMRGPAVLHTVRDMSGLSRDDAVVQDALLSVGLEHERRQRVRRYSQGMRKRLSIAAALVKQPSLLLLDEPTSTLDPEGSDQVHELIRRQRTAGVSQLVSSHDLAGLTGVADRIVVLDRGRVAATGTPAELGQGEGLRRLLVDESRTVRNPP